MISFAFSHTDVDSQVPMLKVKQGREGMEEDYRRDEREEKDFDCPTSTVLVSSLGTSLQLQRTWLGVLSCCSF